MFPFLVKEKLPDSKDIIESTHLGPGTYSPRGIDSRPVDLVKSLQKKNESRVNFGTGQSRFNEVEIEIKKTS